MLPVILNIQTKKEDFNPKNAWDKGDNNMHVYIPLPYADVVEKATTWLSKFSSIQTACEIITYNETKILHFKPCLEKSEEYGVKAWGIGKLKGFAIRFGGCGWQEPEMNSIANVASEFVQILDDTLIGKTQISDIFDELEQNSRNFKMQWVDYKARCNVLQITFANKSTMSYDIATITHGSIPVHFTDDMDIVLSDAIKSLQPLSADINLLIPTDEDAATEISSTSTHIDKDIITSMAQEIALLKESLHKHEAQEQTQAKIIEQKNATIKILATKVADLTEQNAELQVAAIHCDEDGPIDHSIDNLGQNCIQNQTEV